MNKLTPENKKGKPVDLNESVSLATQEEARECFKKAAERMLHPPVWNKLSGPLSAEFNLVNEKGQLLLRPAKTGDYLKIDIPGPGGSQGKKFDWVKVEAIENNTAPDAPEEQVAMRVRACPNPAEKEKEAAHFFKKDATSTFNISRKGNTVIASYQGRNEEPNTNTGKKADNLRNTLVSLGAMAGLSELQWSALIKGFLKK